MLGNNTSEGKVVRVREAVPRDVDRGIARMDPLVEKELSLVSGDIIEIQGSHRATYALYWRGFMEDRGTTTIRLDGEIRRNANIAIDDKVRVRKVEGKEAKRLVIAPVEPVRISGGAEEYFKTFLNGRVKCKGDFFQISVMRSRLGFVVTETEPKGPVIINVGTEIRLSDKPVSEIREKQIPQVTYDSIGGLRNAIQKVREMIELPMRHPELFDRLGIDAPKGVLLHGPPGTGKTLLAKAVANETDANFFSISGPEIMSKFYGESEKQLRDKFEDAKKNAPSIIFIDEIDSIAPKREEVTGEVERRVVAQLLALMDGLESRGRVVVIGATNRPNALDPAIRRGGRFDREIEIGIPDKEGRFEVLSIHARGMPLDADVSLDQIASQTHGFVGADLEALCKEAAMNSLRRILPEINLEEESIPVEVLNKIIVTRSDFKNARAEVEPSGLREVFVEVPDVQWNDIGGLDSVKKELQEAVEWPLKYSELYKNIHAPQTKGILLYGPPGTGKTLLAKAVANQSQANFINVKGPEFLSKWVGESEKAVRETFRKARQAAPCIIFMDEIETVVPVRGSGFGSAQVTERIISQLLTELDGLEELHGVIVIAATNRPDIIDPALLRPGRFDKLIEIPKPDNKAREEIFKIHLRGRPLDENIDFKRLAEHTTDCSGADIEAISDETVMQLIRTCVSNGKTDAATVTSLKITQKDLEAAITKILTMQKKNETLKRRKDDDAKPLYG